MKSKIEGRINRIAIASLLLAASGCMAELGGENHQDMVGVGHNAFALENDVPVTGLSGAEDSQFFDTIEVPAGTSLLSVSISGGTGDADLYVRAGAQPTLGVFDCRPWVNGNAETCDIENPQAGTYHIMIHGYEAYSDLTLSGRYFGAPTELQKNVPVSGLSGAEGDTAYYIVPLASDVTNLSISLSGGSGDADLYVRYGQLPTTAEYDCRPYLGGNNETCDFAVGQAGSYYVMVRAYSAYTGATLVADYDEPASGPITQNTQNFGTSVDIEQKGMHFATYQDRVLVSWRATTGGSPAQYGMVSEYTISPDGTFTLVQELDFGKQCEYIGGMTASSDGSLIAVTCQGFSNTYGNVTESNNAPTTQRPAGISGLFSGASFFNLLSVRGPRGFYTGDIFTWTAPGNDFFVLEFTSGLDNTPDNVILVNSASNGNDYGHYDISLKQRDGGDDLYYVAMKTISNPDSRGILHTDMKEIGLRRNADGTYSRLRITDNYGTGLGVTHPNLTEVAYNEATQRWGRLSHGDAKVSWATIPDQLTSNKGNQNAADNRYEELRFNDITTRKPLSIISLADQGFMALAFRDGSLQVKNLTETVPALPDQVWTELSLGDRGVARLAHFSTDGDTGTNHLVGWSPSTDVYNVQIIDDSLNLVGEPFTLEGNASWGAGNWGFMAQSGCVVVGDRAAATSMQLTALCP